MLLLKSSYNQNSIIIYHKSNGDFKISISEDKKMAPNITRGGMVMVVLEFP
jgi:hypothetical protein